MSQADMVILPMIDGELGVQPRRAAPCRSLGQWRIAHQEWGRNPKRLRIEGGFAQVRSDVVTVLTTKIVG